ncbi:unnamed protein product [Sphagnum compactum]
MAADDDEMENEACVGGLCFLQPHSGYFPPPFYRRIPGREHRWKAGARLRTGPGLQLKIQRAIALPNCLGLGDDARWRWQWIPLSLQTGMKIEGSLQHSQQKVTADNSPCQNESLYMQSIRTFPFARIKVLSPIFGKLALRPVLELLPVPALALKCKFSIGSSKLTMQANLEVSKHHSLLWKLVKLIWYGIVKQMRMVLHPEEQVVGLQYTKAFKLSHDCKAVATGIAEVPSNLIFGRLVKLSSSLPLCVRILSLKVSHTFGTRVPRDNPKPTSVYLRAAKKIGKNDIISIVPGHWIDSQGEPGAAGEREFNLEVVNMLEKQLIENGWEVLRPDRDAPYLSWEEYLNWVSKQTLEGIPLLEIHGQGSAAHYRGHVLGVIGDANAPLSKELAGDFGYFQMDWRELGVPRRGGVIVESFNSDEVLQMAPWHRTWTVQRLANRIMASIERASSANRASRGLFVDLALNEDFLPLDQQPSFTRRH